MTDGMMIPLTGSSQIPRDMSEEEARDFWDAHEITEEFLQQSGPVSEDLLPPVRSNVRTAAAYLDEDTFRRFEAVNKGRVAHVVELMVEAGEDSYQRMVASRAVGIEGQNEKFAHIASLLEKPVSAQVDSFNFVLSYYRANKVEETTRKRIKRCLRRADRKRPTRSTTPKRLTRVAKKQGSLSVR